MPNSHTTTPLIKNVATLPGTLESTTKVRFQDCDPFGHLNNGAYLYYLINQREDQIAEHYGLDAYSWGKEHGTSWVVGKHEIVYRKPAFYHEMVTVQTRLIQFAERHIQVEMLMLDAANTHLKAILWTNFVHVDMKKKRPTVHVPELTHLFEQVHQPLEQAQIEHRVKFLEDELAAAKK